MTLNGHYDREADLLAMKTGQREAVGASSRTGDLSVFLETEDGYIVVAFEFKCIYGETFAFVRLERGYDAARDTLTIGTPATEPALQTENGDLVAHWRWDESDLSGFLEPIGVTVRNAKANFANIRVL